MLRSAVEGSATRAYGRSVAALSLLRHAAHRSGRRVALLVFAAFALYGSWAFIVNLAHGAAVALRAGLLQGASSGVTTLVIGSVIESLHAALPSGRRRALLAAAVAASLSACVHLAVHLTAGTPEVLRTVLPSVVIGYVFAASYAFALEQPRIRITWRAPSALTAAEREDVWSLVARSVQRDRRAFEEKLGLTGEAFLGHLPTGELVAFGAVDAVEAEVAGRTEAVLYTHWAVLDPRARANNVIQRVGFRCFLRYRLRHPLRPVSWMFSASTYQSYLLLVRNYVTYWPRPDAPWTERARALRDAVMAKSGDPTWDAEAGVLRRHGATRYREGVVDDDPRLLDHPVIGPAVGFFRAQNPLQVEGDSLLCLCPLSAANWWACARVALGRRARGRQAP